MERRHLQFSSPGPLPHTVERLSRIPGLLLPPTARLFSFPSPVVLLCTGVLGKGVGGRIGDGYYFFLFLLCFPSWTCVAACVCVNYSKEYTEWNWGIKAMMILHFLL